MPDEQIWCDPCQYLVGRHELKEVSIGDAIHYLCPGCDSDLLPSRNPDLEHDLLLAEQEEKEAEE